MSLVRAACAAAAGAAATVAAFAAAFWAPPTLTISRSVMLSESAVNWASNWSRGMEPCSSRRISGRTCGRRLWWPRRTAPWTCRARRRERQIDVVLVALRQGGDHLNAVELEGRLEAGALHGVGEAAGVARDGGVHLVGRRMERIDLLAGLLRERLALQHDRADLVLGLAHALVVAAHAGNPVGHGQILLVGSCTMLVGPLESASPLTLLR